MVIADDITQDEVVKNCNYESVQVYDYSKHIGDYYFNGLKRWIMGYPDAKVFILSHFDDAIQSEAGIKRLNFSRDMLYRLGKNIIFLVTPHGDERLSMNAYDFYSFINMQVEFE